MPTQKKLTPDWDALRDLAKRAEKTGADGWDELVEEAEAMDEATAPLALELLGPLTPVEG